MSQPTHLGFPVPLLGWEPMRLIVLFDDGERIALEKPPGLLVQPDPWYPRLPVLVEAIRHQAGAGKPEFRRLGIGESGLWAVHELDPECCGPVLFCRRREQAEAMRNALGSEAFRFTFEFLAKAAPPADPVTCHLPLARHHQMRRMLVSHTTGKQAETLFNGGEALGAYAICQATTAYPRRHQILLHAFESGLPVLGDTVYAGNQPIFLSNLKRDYRPRRHGEERPLMDGPAYYLKELQAGPDCRIGMPGPPRWNNLRKQLEKYSRP
jgi:23S rRNA-/tRNA-specific pseudouridylate synthase